MPLPRNHRFGRHPLVLKDNRSLWGIVVVLIVMVLAYQLYARYYGHQNFFPKLEQGILSR